VDLPKNLKITDQTFNGIIDVVFDRATNILNKPLHTYFTDHSIEHSKRIIRIVDKLLEGAPELYLGEKFTLICAILLHDIGMQYSKRSGEKLPLTFQALSKIRDCHHLHSKSMIKNSVNLSTRDPYYLGLNAKKEYVNSIATVAKYHRKLSIESLENTAIGDDTIRIQLLSALIRLGDCIDCDYRRVNLDILKIQNFLDKDVFYCYSHNYVQAITLDSLQVKIFFRLPTAYKNTSVATRIVDHIKKEVADQINEVYGILDKFNIRLHKDILINITYENTCKKLPPTALTYFNSLVTSSETNNKVCSTDSSLVVPSIQHITLEPPVNEVCSTDSSLVERGLELSRSYVKPRVSEALFDIKKVEDITVKHVNHWFDNKRADHNRWLDFFHPLLNVKKTMKGKSGNKHNIVDPHTLLEWIEKTLMFSSYNSPISVKGSMKSGKSVFLCYCYLYLFYQYAKKQFNFIPVYINVENYRKHTTVSDFVKNAKSAYDDFVKNVDKYADECNKPICFIIDGLSDHKHYGTDEVEQHIMNTIRNRRADNVDNGDKYIFVIDSSINDGAMERTCVRSEQNDAVEYIIYFNPIVKISKNSGEGGIETNKFIENYCSIFKTNNINPENIIKNFSSLNLPYIDLHFLTQFGQKLSQTCFTSTLSDLYRNYFMTIVSERYRKCAVRDAFLMHYLGEKCDPKYKYYSAFEHELDVDTFEIIKNEQMLVDYLVAEYYVTNIKKHCNSKGGCDYAVLNRVFWRSISAFIIDIIRNDGLAQTIASHAESLYNRLDNMGKSCLTCILGRTSLQPNRLQEILGKQQKVLSSSNVNATDIFSLVAERSIAISEINMSNRRDFSRSNAYLVELLKNSKKREINRSFNRFFYDDIPIDDFMNNDARDEIKRGFDFYHTFHILASKIEKVFIKDGNVYPLLSVDLFTLCNLVQVRLQKQINMNNDELSELYFFNPKYPYKRTVVNRLILFLDTYLNSVFKHENTELVQQYFILIKNMLEKYNEQLKTSDDGKALKAFNPISVLNDIELLFTVERICWKINDYGGDSVSKQVLDSLPKTASPIETMAQHVFSTYMIGLFFLPKNLDYVESVSDDEKKKYSKQKVLNLIMIHELGRIKVGDKPPHYEAITQFLEDENTFNKALFLHGTYENMADVIDIYGLWDSWYIDNCYDINVRIAKDLDKIQMLLKYCTLTLSHQLSSFSDKRKQNIKKEIDNIKTSIGIKILNVLVLNNFDVYKL